MYVLDNIEYGVVGTNPANFDVYMKELKTNKISKMRVIGHANYYYILKNASKKEAIELIRWFIEVY